MASQAYDVFDDTLKTIYAAAGRSTDFFEDVGPALSLYRSQTADDYKNEVFLLHARPKIDVKIVRVDDRDVVKGCLAVSGNQHTGVSTFDKPVSVTKNHTVIYEIEAKVPLPPGLAITKDAFNKTFQATHYTIAPKNDMTLDLFIVSLKQIAGKATRIAGGDE